MGGDGGDVGDIIMRHHPNGANQSGFDLVGRERLGDPSGGAGALGQKGVGAAVEQDHGRDVVDAGTDRSVSQCPGHGHSAHGPHLHVDHDRVDVLIGGAGRGGGRIIVIDQGEVWFGERGVHFVANPRDIGDDEDLWHRAEDSDLGCHPVPTAGTT